MSRTAVAVAGAVALASRTPGLSDVIAPDAGRLAYGIVRGASPCLGWALGAGVGRRALWGLEQRALPGFVAHIAARKAWIERAVRGLLGEGAAEGAGARRLIVAGAGLDTLAARLSAEMAWLRCVEVDRTPPPSAKAACLVRHGYEPVEWAEADLAVSGLPVGSAVIGRGGAGETVVLAEGLLMYLSAGGVERFLESAGECGRGGAARVRLVFTAMRAGAGGAIGFDGQSRFVDRWMRSGCEPFRWAIDPEDAGAWLRGRGWRLLACARNADLRAVLGGYGGAMAEGEWVGVAERVGSE